MSPIEYNRKLDRIISLIETENKPLKVAVQTVHALRITRIFDKGENQHGSLIGHGAYDDNHELYVNPKKYPTLPQFKPAGKPFEVRTKSGKIKRKRDTSAIVTRARDTIYSYTPGRVGRFTRWFASYKDFRTMVKRPVDRVNLGLTYDLRFDLSNSSSKKVNLPDKISAHEYHERLKRAHNIDKADGLDEKYKGVFGFQQKERDDFNRILQVELTNLMK